MKEFKKISKSGAITVPIRLRRELNIKNGDAVTIEPLANGGMVIKPYRPSCIFCGAENDIKELNGKGCCVDCMLALEYAEVIK